MSRIKKKKNVKKRGFASLSKERQREIASMGGKAAHAKGTAHTWTSEEARAAGKIGGRATQNKGKKKKKVKVL